MGKEMTSEEEVEGVSPKVKSKGPRFVFVLRVKLGYLW